LEERRKAYESRSEKMQDTGFRRGTQSSGKVGGKPGRESLVMELSTVMGKGKNLGESKRFF